MLPQVHLLRRGMMRLMRRAAAELHQRLADRTVCCHSRTKSQWLRAPVRTAVPHALLGHLGASLPLLMGPKLWIHHTFFSCPLGIWVYTRFHAQTINQIHEAPR